MSRAGWVRRLLDAITVGLARLTLHVFFRDVRLTGLDRIPQGVPLVFVANHNNSVVDSVLLLALPSARPRMLAKSTLFSHPVMGPLLALVGALPVYRHTDPGVDPSRNFETFARCRDVLAAGGRIALFPEGASHNEPRRLPFKSGAARIALEAETLRGPLGLRLVPVALTYEAKQSFRSRARVSVGHLVDPAPEVLRHPQEPRAAVRALTGRIARALEDAISAPEPPADAGSDEPARPSRRPLIRLPVAVIFYLGCALNWIPYRIPGWLSDAWSKTPDEPATYKMLAGLLAFPSFWATEAALAALYAGPVWGLVISLVAPASGYAALRIHEAWQPRGQPRGQEG